MTLFTDGHRLINIAMLDLRTGVDSAADILEPDILGYECNLGAWVVEDLDALIEWCEDWESGNDEMTIVASVDATEAAADPWPGNAYNGRSAAERIAEEIENRSFIWEEKKQ